MRPVLRSMVVAAFLAAVARLLVAAPVAGRSEPPAELSWSSLDSWYEQVGPAVAVAEVIRAVALILTVWLLLAVALQALVSLPHLRLARPAVDLITPRALQRVLHGVAGASFAAMVAIPTGDLPNAGPPPDIAVMQVIEDDRSAPTSSTATSEPPTTTTSSTTTPSSTTSSTTTPSSTTSSTSPSTTTPPPGGATPTAGAPDGRTPRPDAIDPTSPPTTRVAVPTPTASSTTTPSVTLPTVVTPTAVVQGGDSFWTIAEGQLQLAGRTPSERDVVRYWERLVAANVNRLVDPSNPDLLYPGQVLELPPV